MWAGVGFIIAFVHIVSWWNNLRGQVRRYDPYLNRARVNDTTSHSWLPLHLHVAPTSRGPSLAVTHQAPKHGAHTHRCNHTNKVPTLRIFAPTKLCLEDSRRPGKPSVGPPSAFLCMRWWCFISVPSCWLLIGLYIWPGSSSQAELPRCPFGSLELGEAQRGSGKVVTLQDLQLSPRGIGVLVSQGEWCHTSVQTRQLTNVTAAALCDGRVDESSHLSAQKWKSKTESLSGVDQFYYVTHQIWNQTLSFRKCQSSLKVLWEDWCHSCACSLNTKQELAGV